MRFALGLSWGQPNEIYYQLREGITLVVRHPKPKSSEPYIEGKYPRVIGNDAGEFAGVVAINDGRISREHGMIEFDGTAVNYTDNSSTNGTFLGRNGKVDKLHSLSRYSLEHGDTLLFAGPNDDLPYKITVINRTSLESTRYEW